MNAAVKKDIRDLNREELLSLIRETGQPAFRAKQIWSWCFAKKATQFQDMTDLPLSLRNQLEESYQFHLMHSDQVQQSADGTIKVRFQLHDEKRIEGVIIPAEDQGRYTACVSSQVGCSLTCKFCATGKMGRIRNLKAYEIFDQVIHLNAINNQSFGTGLTNIVYMGMGEPLLNYQECIGSVEMLTHPEGHGMSARRITVSTAGIAKMIRQCADDQVRFNLALSLHAANDEKRNQIMPINESNHLEVLMSALTYFYQVTGNRISYEYILLKGFNDTVQDARQLLKLTQQNFPVRINLIEYNPIGDGVFDATSEDTAHRFMETVAKGGATVTLRRSRGKDIDAACGQLANK